MNLTAGIIFFNDKPEIFEKTLKALKKHNIPIVAIDGKFKEFPGEVAHSTNGCIELAKQYADCYISAPKWGWETQAQKRTMYFKVLPVNSYVFHVDADEELVLFKNIPKLIEDHYIVFIRHGGTDSPSIRVHKVNYDTQYLYSHYRLYRLRLHDPRYPDSGVVTKAHSIINTVKTRIPGIILLHRTHERSDERKELKNIYYKTRNEMLNSGEWPKEETCTQCGRIFRASTCPWCKI